MESQQTIDVFKRQIKEWVSHDLRQENHSFAAFEAERLLALVFKGVVSLVQLGRLEPIQEQSC